jgi:N-acetylneuraminate synthase
MKVPAYNSLPEQCDVWFKAFKKAKEMCGPPGTQKRIPPEKEIKYLDKLVRGVYAKKDLPAGHVLTDADCYLAVPLLQGQISCREFMRGEKLLSPIEKDGAIRIDEIDSPYSDNPALKSVIYQRGLDPKAPMGPDFQHGTQAVGNVATSVRPN